MMRGANDIYVLEVASKFRVRPAVWSCNGKPNEDLKLRNMTTKNLVVIVPGKVTKTGSDEMKPVAPGAFIKIDLKSLASGSPAESSPYVVLVQGSSGFEPAQGESDPIIIIDP
jgi:hypothetical protein